VNNLKEALADRIKNARLDGRADKKEALKKLAAMNVKIGYPDKWLDYSLLEIDRGPFGYEHAALRKICRRSGPAKIGKPVDRTDWE